MLKKLLALLTRNPRISNRELAKILGTTETKVEAEIARLVKSGEIVGFKTMLNTNLHAGEEVTAMVEVRVATKRGSGFDGVAERIANFPEVVSVYLISGSHDLNVQVRGKNLHEVAGFVSSKLATLEDVLGTRTHFILKKYKEDNLSFGEKKSDTRLLVSA
jgi:DNA-binding Lrp family transcriptional regulator